ncbi:hypothetical protein EDD37DRAFT_649922 [Exophiala viscosa]|uniref:Uncharacterized protein n=1 Tax=Exophiala viscosa TaxID=2486360 RepID=A0AAN6DZE6_9EURO|nr:hypothetical protein EDD36DRAFT_175718 [Exophiala viscosa]KAI1624028.1 hypothetical protein EDD37DRAFT_649922 [Exophiala viscosa]
MESPAKRRRVDGPDVEPDDEEDTENAPRTPTRASYRSPTKSSIARSHPHLITRSGRQAATEPRGKVLLDDILKNRPVASDALQTVSKIDQSAEETINDSVAHRTDEHPAEQEPNERIERSEETNGASSEPKSSQSAIERPVLQASRIKRRNDEMAFSPPIMPTLIRRTDSGTRARSRPGSDEPELPPTPVELGLSTAPDRPRGLASSSSPRSKSGSGSHRRRTRSGAPVTSSPLKPKGRPPGQDGNEASESRPIDVNEAAESDIEESEDEPPKSDHRKQPETEVVTHSESQNDEAMKSRPDTNADVSAKGATSQAGGHSSARQADVSVANDRLPNNLPSDLQDKQASLRRLRAELSRLKEENETLERVIGSEGNLEGDHLATILQLVSKNGPPQPNNTRSYATPPDLTKFLPGKLDFRHQTETLNVEGRVQLGHDLKVRAPAPWPVSVFAFALGVVVDIESGQVKKVKLNDDRRNRPPLGKGARTGILKWASERIQPRPDSLRVHQFDVGGTIWGIGKWFEAAVERAKTFRLLDLQYNMSVDEDILRKEHDQALTQETAIALSKYLEVIQVQFEAHPPAFRRGRGLNNGTMKAKVLLIWDMNVDWTGSISSRIDLVLSGISGKAEGALKQVFSSLVPTKGVREAFTVTWKMIHAEDDDFDVQIKGKTQTENSNNTGEGEAAITTEGKRKRAENEAVSYDV